MTSSVILTEWSGIKMKMRKNGTVVMTFSADKIKKDRLTYGIPVDTKWNDKPMEYFNGMTVVFKLDDNGELIEPGTMKYYEDGYKATEESIKQPKEKIDDTKRYLDRMEWD